MMVGNDIVDITAPYAASKAYDERFLARVFNHEEKDCIKKSFNPTLTLWSIWSAKETAFKIAKKQNSKTIFCHKAFCVHNPPQRYGKHNGHVTHHERIYAVHWDANCRHVHCVGASHDGEVYFCIAPLDEEFEDQSIKVRLLAKQILSNVFQKKANIVRAQEGTRLGPPSFVSNTDSIDDIDLSLSHDGNFIAATVGRKDKSK